MEELGELASNNIIADIDQLSLATYMCVKNNNYYANIHAAITIAIENAFIAGNNNIVTINYGSCGLLMDSDDFL